MLWAYSGAQQFQALLLGESAAFQRICSTSLCLGDAFLLIVPFNEASERTPLLRGALARHSPFARLLCLQRPASGVPLHSQVLSFLIS